MDESPVFVGSLSKILDLKVLQLCCENSFPETSLVLPERNPKAKPQNDMYDFFPANNGMNQLAIPQTGELIFPDFQG